MICFLPRGMRNTGDGALSLSPGRAEAARFPHPSAGRSCRRPRQLHPLLPDHQGNLEEHSPLHVTHTLQAEKAQDGGGEEFLPLAMAVL